MDILDRISALLKSRGLSQKELCSCIGIKNQAFSSWKSGINKSYLKYLPQIADFLGVSVDFLVSGEGETSSTSSPMPELPAEAAEIVSRYARLDEIDRARALAYIDGMLGADKYNKVTVKIAQKNTVPVGK